MRAARVHHAARRRGGRVAARGARAAAGDAGDRVSPQLDVADVAHRVAAFRQGLKEAASSRARTSRSSTAGRRVKSIGCRCWWPIFVRRQVAVIVGNTPSALAAKAATTTVPIVFATGGDPVRAGLVASLNRPGGNVTGVSFCRAELGAKRLELLRELVPGAARIAVLVDPKWPLTERFVSERAGRGVGRWAATRRSRCQQRPRDRDRLCNARPTRGWRAALRCRRVLALPTGPDCRAGGSPRIPAIYVLREAVAAGGLMSYGPALPMPIVKSAFMPVGSSKARSRPTCRSCSRPSSSS